MKKKLFLVLLLSITSLGFSQTLDQLKTEAKLFYDAQYNMDFEKIVSYMHPKVFETMNKEELLTALDQSYQNEQFRMRVVLPKTTFTFSEIKETEGKKVCKVEYPQTIRMIFENPLSDEEKNAIEQSIITAKPAIKVRFEKDRNAFYIESSEILIAISEETTQNRWKLIMYDKSQQQEFATLLGEHVINALGL
jgi:hypothetical protein